MLSNDEGGEGKKALKFIRKVERSDIKLSDSSLKRFRVLEAEKPFFGL